MKRIVVSLAAVLVVLGAVASFAQEPAEATALDGYCPVAYVAMNKAVKGDPGISLDFAGTHYVFANAKAREMFEADPSKYHVAYDGYCATAASMGKKLESDPSLFTVAEGTTYLFSSPKAKKMFDANPANITAKADAQWALIHPAFSGYCPVAYVVAGKSILGKPELSVDYEGSHYVFANAKAKKMFEANPAKVAGMADEQWTALN